MKNRYISILGLVVPLTMTVQDATSMDMLSHECRGIIEQINNKLKLKHLIAARNQKLINIKKIVTDKIISSDSHEVAIGLNELIEAIPTLRQYRIIRSDEAAALEKELHTNKDIQELIEEHVSIKEVMPIREMPHEMRNDIANQGEMLFDGDSHVEIIWANNKAMAWHDLARARIKIKEEPIELDRLRGIIHREGIKLTGDDEITDEMAGYIAYEMKNEIPTRKRLREIIEQIQHTPLNSHTDESAMIIRYLIERANADKKLIPQLEKTDAIIDIDKSAKENIDMIMDKYKIKIDNKNDVDMNKKAQQENEIKEEAHKEEEQGQRNDEMQIAHELQQIKDELKIYIDETKDLKQKVDKLIKENEQLRLEINKMKSTGHTNAEDDVD